VVARAFAGQRNGFAGIPGPGCSSDPMHIIFAVLGNIIVNDHFQAIDVESSSRYIRGHKKSELPSHEIVDDLQSSALGEVASQVLAAEAVVLQFLG